MTHITKYLHFPKKKITHIKRDCPKSHFISKNSSIASCHLLRGSTPKGGGSLKNDFLDSPLFLLKKNKGAYLPMITQEKPMTESFPLGKHFPPKNYFRIIRKGQFSITVRIRNACS